MLKESEQSKTLEIRDNDHPSASGCLAAFLHGNKDEGRFATFQLTAPAQAGLGITNPRIINFHFASQWLACQVDHRAPEFMEHHPGRFIPAQGELALQEQRRETALVSRHQVSGPEPNRQRNFCVMQDRSGRQRNLMPTTGALPTPQLHQFVCSPLSASSTNEAIGPATGGQVLLTRFIAREFRLEFAQRLRKRRARHVLILPVVVC